MMAAKIFNNPGVIICLYFLVLIIIGIYSFFRVKNQRDYFVAGKRGNLIQISGSLFATIVGASALLGTFELSRKEGWSAMWFLASGTIGLIILTPLVKKVSRFGHYTLPELIGSFYGKKAELAASAIIPLAWTGIIAAQIVAAARILDGLNLLHSTPAAFLTGGIFIIYTLIGGQISVIKTDVFQAFLIYAGLLLVFFKATGSVVNDHSILPIPERLFTETFGPFDLVILFLTYSVTFIVGPDIYSRIFCARSAGVARSSVLITAILLLPVGYIMSYLGIFSLSGDLTSHSKGLAELGANILPGWASGLFAAALLSAVMSSASATLLTSSTIISSLLTGSFQHRKTISNTRIFIVVTGIISILIALYVKSIIESLLFALSFFSGAFVLPVLAGLLRIRVNRLLVVWAILSGGIIALAGKIVQVFIAEHPGNILIITAYIVNALFLFYQARNQADEIIE
jgi:solute:Na+ symporter, SSS family